MEQGAKLLPFTDKMNADLFARDLRNLIAPFYGLTLKNVNLGKILMGSSGIAAKHHLVVPTELMLFFKSLVSMESLGRRISPDFDFLSASLEFATEIVKHQFEPTKALDQMTRLIRDSQHLLRDLPRQVHFLLRKVNSPDHRIRLELTGMNALRKGIEQSFNLLFLGIVIGSLVISSSMLAVHPQESIPTLATAGYALSAFLGLLAFVNYLRK